MELKKLIITKYLKILSVFLVLVLILAGCDNSAPSQSAESDNSKLFDEESFYRRSRTRTNQITVDMNSTAVDANLVQTSAKTVKFQKQKDKYETTVIGHFNGSSLLIWEGSLSPPDYMKWGDPVTITMTVEKDPVNNQLIYSFGPSGCQFWPPASLWISWKDLGSETAELYYIDETGQYVRQEFDGINLFDYTYLIFITHFSRYAVAYSD